MKQGFVFRSWLRFDVVALWSPTPRFLRSNQIGDSTVAAIIELSVPVTGARRSQGRREEWEEWEEWEERDRVSCRCNSQGKEARKSGLRPGLLTERPG